MNKRFTCHIISSTHWDREWYMPFQKFRRKLVNVIDELIQTMENNPEFKNFHLDGQTIVLEDYYEIRPENRKRLEKLIKDGRIEIGPWYVMPDSFLLSGESLVRNLQKGISITKDLDVAPSPNGYMCDIFGHNAQMPQIFKGFNINATCLFRGIAEYPKDTFDWQSPDGSKVLCMKLDRERSYSNFYFAIRWPFEELKNTTDEMRIQAMQKLLEYSIPMAATNQILMLDGVDHMGVEPRVPEFIKLFNENFEDVEFIHSNFTAYEKAVNGCNIKLSSIKGELYYAGEKGINNQVLKNVLSSNVDLKQANRECEDLLTSWAEPLDLMTSTINAKNNQGFLDLSWKYLMQNHPHDSICGCSITKVHQDNFYRFRQSKDISEGILAECFNTIASNIDGTSLREGEMLVLFNSSQKRFEGIVEVELKLPVNSEMCVRIYDRDKKEIPYQVLGVRKASFKNNFLENNKLISIDQYMFLKVAFYSEVEPVGYTTYTYDDRYGKIGPRSYSHEVFCAPIRYMGTMQKDVRTWENEYLKLTVMQNGSLTVINKETGKEYSDLMIFEDMEDLGDGWRYKSAIKSSRFLTIGCRYDFSVEQDGINMATLKFVHYLNLPYEYNNHITERTGWEKEYRITTYVTIKKGSRKIEFRTVLDNNVVEHRLRVLFPTYMSTDTYFTNTAFFQNERNIKKQDSSNSMEVDAGTAPNLGVSCIKDGENTLALYNKGLYEIAVLDDESKSLALTLARSFKHEVGQDDRGQLSRLERHLELEYALEFLDARAEAGEIQVSGDAWRTGIKTFTNKLTKGQLLSSNSFLQIKGQNIVLSALYREQESIILRVYNPSEKEAKGRIYVSKVFGVKEVAEINFLGEKLNNLDIKDSCFEIELNPGKIATYILSRG